MAQLSYDELVKKYSTKPAEQPSASPAVRRTTEVAETAEQSQSAAVRGDRRLTDLIAGLLPKPKAQTEAKPKRDAAAYEQAKQEARKKKAMKGYAEQKEKAAADKATYDAGVAEIEALSADERQQLQNYVAERNSAQVNNLLSGVLGTGPQFDTYNMNPIVQKYGIGKVRQMAETYERMQNEQLVQDVAEGTAQALEGKAGIGHNVASIGANAVGGIVSTIGRAQELANRTGQYQTLQEHTAGDALNVYAGTVREETAKKIEGDEYDEEGNLVKEGGALRKGLSIGYQGVMSAADSIARAALGGGGAGTLALAATGSFSQTVGEASKQGASPAQAIILGVGTAAIEAATEKVPLDNLLKAAKGGVKGAKAIAKEALKQAAIEATEEEISLFANLLWEASVLQDKSSYKQQIAEAIANGATYEEAKAQANKAIWAEALNTAAVSAVAGGVSGGGSAFVGNILGGGAETDVAAEEGAQSLAEPAQQPQTEQAAQVQTQQDVAQAVEQELTQAQQAEAEEQAAQEQAQEAIAQGMAEQYGPMMPQVEPKSQMQQDIDNATAAVLAENGIGQAQQTEQKETAQPEEMVQVSEQQGDKKRQLWGKRTDWESLTDNSVFATALAMKEVNPAYYEAYMAAADGGQPSPVIQAVINAANDVRQESVSPMAAATVINEVYEKNGAEGLTQLYNPANGNLYESVLNRMKEVDSTRGKVDADNAEVKGTGAAEQNKSVGGMESQFKHEVKRSAIYDNTYKNSPNADVRLIGREAERQDPNIGQYDAITEKESLHEAELRTETGRDRYSEYRYLLGKDGWTGADNDTAAKLLDTYRREKKVDMFTALAKKQREMGTQAGQMVQSFAKYSRGNATDAATDAVLDLDNLTIDQIDTTFWNPKNEAKTTAEKKNALQKWKENVSTSLMEVADDIDNVEDGDIESIKGIVRQLANLRHTTAWAGYSNELTRRTERGLDKMDFETLKTVAKTQLSMVPNDFRKRKPAEIIKQMRMQNMLFTLTTKLKNDTGNISNGLMDAVSDSFGGRMMDAIIGKYTGMRTVANDLKYAAEYRKAAKDAADVAGAFVSLDIPMEADAKYAVNSTRTWSPNTTNTLFRLASAFEKHLKYSLEVSDKFYEGGATHVVSKSLQGLGEKSGLTAEQIQDLARKTGERRTFKDPGYGTTKDGQPKKGRAGARVASGVQQALNQLGTEDIGAGDLLIPFAKVAAEVKQVGMDYTGSGLITGLGEVVSIIKDAKNGKEIDPYRQRSAATNFGRGITGVALTAAFAAMANAGAIKVHNEKDQEEKTMDQAQGLSGAQWNMDATLRWIDELRNGGSLEDAQSVAGWEDGDELVSVDFLEPFNTQMHIGCLIAEGESIPESVLKGNFEAMLEMPMMQTFSDLADIQQAFTEVSEGDMGGVLDATGQLLGTVAGAAIPNAARKVAQVIDPYYRDTYDTNPIKKAGKQLVAGIPFLSQTLPKKYDNFGQEQRRYEEGDEINAAIDALVTPWDTDTYKTDAVYIEVERLNEALKNSDINVTPPQPKRKINYTDKTGVDHDGYVLTEEQYQKIATVQGQTEKKAIDKMVNSMEYKALTDVQKAYAMNAIYEYAAEKGKQTAIPDYYSKAAAWIAKTKESDIHAFIARGTEKAMNDAIGNAVERYANNWTVSDAAKADMEATYEAFGKMYPQTQAKILDDLASDALRYIEYKGAGVSTDNYLDITKDLQNIRPEEGKVNARQVQKAETIVNNPNLTEAQKVEIIKTETSDTQAENIDELEAIFKSNKELKKIGFSVKDYAKLYSDHEDYTSGKGKKDRTIQKWMKDYGISYNDAKALYEVFS